MTIRLGVLHITRDLAVWSDISDDLVHPFDRIPIGMWILGLAQKMVVNFFVDIFGLFAPPNEIVSLGELEDVDVGH